MNHPILSEKRVRRLRLQGFVNQSEQELSQLAFGIRFAYRLCTALLIVGVLTQSIAIFSFMFVIAFLGATLPNHPFDYIYNHFLSEKMNRPTLPTRAPQLRFACMIATIWIGTIDYFMSSGAITAATVLSAFFIFIAGLLSTTDICIPSIIYKAAFQRNQV